MSWGVTPVMCEEFDSMEVLFYNGMNKAKEVLSLEKDDTVVLTGGVVGRSGSTNTIRVEKIH